MTVYVATCDKYRHLMTGFARQFNKYWGSDQQVTVLGFAPPPELPPNFTFHQMEEVETRPWTTNLRLFFKSVPDRHFVFLLDDYWMIRPLDRRLVNLMECQVRSGAVKGDLSNNTNYFAHTTDGEFVVADQKAQYRTSTQPAIWERKYLLSLLRKDLNPWQFELQDSPECVQKGRIVGLPKQVYEYANIMYKGEPASYMIDLISEEDRAALRDMGAFDQIL